MAKHKKTGQTKKKTVKPHKARPVKPTSRHIEHRVISRGRIKTIRLPKIEARPGQSLETVKANSAKLLKQLMDKAVERGFVTEAEIIHAMPYFEDDLGALEQVMDNLEKRDVEVVDQQMASEWGP